MPNPLQGGLASELAKGLRAARMLRPAVLIRPVSTMRIPGAVSQGTNPQPTSYAAEGFLSSTRKQFIGGTQVITGDHVITLIGLGLAVDPQAGDKVSIDGVTRRVVGVDVDGGRAAFVLLTRD